MQNGPGLVRSLVPAALVALAFAGGARSAEPRKGEISGSVERLDPRLDALIPPGATIEKLAEGFDWSEGTAWDAADGSIVFSDVPRNVVLRWKEGVGLKTFLKPSGYTGATPRGGEPGSNGLAFDASGRLTLCQHGDRRVARLEGGKFVTLADRFEGKRLNSPNDLVFNKQGDLFFTDPPYGLLKANDDPAKELPFNGVYRLSRAGVQSLLTKDLSFPNGIGLSPDEKTLYVANSDPARAVWMAYDLAADGTLGAGRILLDATARVKGRKGLPDGLKVDRAGNLFATGPGGVFVIAPDGTHLGTIVTGEANGNCAWGGDGTALYIAADMYLARIKTATRGKGR